MKKITKIETQKKRKNRVSIFVNDSFFCGVPQEVILKLNLYKGKEVDEKELEELIREKSISEAKQKMKRILSRKLYSEKEIIDKLRNKGYEEDTIETVVKELKEYSLIDDYAFTRAFIHDRVNLNPKGSFRIAYELKQKGVDRDIINKIFQEENIVEGDRERALELVQKRMKTKPLNDKRKQKQRLYNYLLRRGFSFAVIKETLDELLS
jgi:regulatory protein